MTSVGMLDKFFKYCNESVWAFKARLETFILDFAYLENTVRDIMAYCASNLTGLNATALEHLSTTKASKWEKGVNE